VSHNMNWKIRWKEKSLHIVTRFPLTMSGTNTDEYPYYSMKFTFCHKHISCNSFQIQASQYYMIKTWGLFILILTLYVSCVFTLENKEWQRWFLIFHSIKKLFLFWLLICTQQIAHYWELLRIFDLHVDVYFWYFTLKCYVYFSILLISKYIE